MIRFLGKIVPVIFLLTSVSAMAQTVTQAPSGLRKFLKREIPASRKGQFSVYWGYNRGYYTKSDIHVHGEQFDFTVHKAKAKDRPQPFTFDDYFNPAKLSIPQFNVRIGYMASDKWSFSFGYDHMKYVMVKDQVARVSGAIDRDASYKYGGDYFNQRMKIGTDLLTFEHTDGLNIISLDAERHFRLLSFNKNRFLFRFVTGLGAGAVVPRSDVRVLGEGLNCNFHLAGYSVSAKAGLRLEFLGNLFLQVESRAGYVNLPSILIDNTAGKRGSQHFEFLQWHGALGGYFRLFHKK